MLKFYIYIVSIIFSLGSLNAQEAGFIQAYELNKGAMTFHDMVIVEDTLVVCGEIKDTSAGRWGFFFAKLDTMGNILSSTTHYDSMGDSYVFEQGYEMIKTSDGGYAIVGQVYFRRNIILIKLDSEGKIEFIKEYPDEQALDVRHRSIIEVNNGFISIGVKQQPGDYKNDAFIMRTDSMGGKIWEIEYGKYNLWDSFIDLYKLNENRIIVIGGTFITSLEVESYFDIWNKSVRIIIDTTGVFLEENVGSKTYLNNSRSILDPLKMSFDGNWYGSQSHIKILNTEKLLKRLEIIKRDSNFNLIWSTEFKEATTNLFSDFIDVIQCPDSGYIAAGQYYKKVYFPHGQIKDAYLGGMLAKVNKDGDSLWSRIDTVFSHPNGRTEHYLSAVGVLSSGSIVACGHLNRYSPDPRKSYGWIIKVNKNGCMETGCNPQTSSENMTSLLENFTVFPVPTTDRLTIEGKGEYTYKIYNLQGRTIRSGEGTAITTFNITESPSGIYFVKIRQGNQYLTKKVVKE